MGEAAVTEYEQQTKENDVVKTTKAQDVKYKDQEAAALDKSVSELKGDLSGTKDELAAVVEYLKKIEEKCIAKPESYEDRVKARNAEIAGLKEAMTILDGEAV